MQSAAYGIFRTLDARPVLIGELCDDGKRFLPQTTIGLPRELVPADPGAIADASLAGRALRSATAVRLCIGNEPGWLEDLPYLREQAVASGLAAVIRDAAGPRGLVLAFGGEADRFSDADLDFVQAIANLLGMQMDRDRLLADRGEPALSLVSN